MAFMTNILAWVKKNPTLVMTLVVLYFIVKRYKKRVQQRFFAFLMSKMDKNMHPPMKALKEEHFSSLKTLKSADPDLKAQKTLKILEIGVGTGANFSYYPDNTRLVVVDPNPNFQTYFDKNKADFPKIRSGDIIVAYGEDMKAIPSNSVDVVVTTLVMCSVEDTEKVFDEIRRVLVPGGKYYFMEHIREYDFGSRVRYFRYCIQEFLTKTGIFPLFFDNCHLNRDMLDSLHEAGFSDVSAKRIHSPQTTKTHLGYILWLVVPHLIGTATK